MKGQTKFTIIVSEARLTRDTATFGSMDPYALVNINSNLFKTKIAKSGGKNPKWNETFEIVSDNDTDELDIKVMDDGIGGSDPIGCCTIRVRDLL